MQPTYAIVASLAIVSLIRAQESPTFTSLLSGDSLTGWVVEHPGPGRVTFAEGVLLITHRTGWVRTARKSFGDFRLRFEIQSSSSSTRALLGLFGWESSRERPGTALAVPLLSGVLPPATAFGNMRLKLLLPSDTAVVKALRGNTGWQAYEIVRRANTISVVLNGTVILTDRAPTSLDGWVGFLANSGDVSIRNIGVAELPPPTVLAGGIYRPGNGVTLPVPLAQPRPNYTSDAMRAKVQGTVLLECVVEPDGTVSQIEVVRSLDSRFGLDEEAVKAARQWRFKPGIRDGEPVPVLVTIELTFSLGK
jgi:TonB family protein